MVTSSELKAARRKARLTQEKLGAAVGLSAFTIARAEKNIAMIHYANAQKLDQWYIDQMAAPRSPVAPPLPAIEPTNGAAPPAVKAVVESPAAMIETMIPAWNEAWPDAVKTAWLTCIGNVAKAIEVANHTRAIANRPEK